MTFYHFATRREHHRLSIVWEKRSNFGKKIIEENKELMPKSAPQFTLLSYGRYTVWERSSRKLPKVTKHTLDIPLELGVEFGFILSVKKGKGEVLEYVIEPPPFCDEDGVPMPPFEGTYFVDSNDFQFFLGDTVWEPLIDKAGFWTLIVRHKGREVTRKSFCIKNGIDLSENP